MIEKSLREYLALIYKACNIKKFDFDTTNQILFIHIPKTGGTSIASALYGAPKGHPTLYEYYLSNPILTKEYYKFCVVRNPFDRLVSTFAHITHNDINPKIKNVWNKLEIETFDDLINRLDDPRTYKILRSRIMNLRPQYDMIKHSKVKMEKIYKFENYNTIVEELKTKFNVDIKKLNSSPRKNYRDYYDNRTIEVVKRRFKKNLNNFNYTF